MLNGFYQPCSGVYAKTGNPNKRRGNKGGGSVGSGTKRALSPTPGQPSLASTRPRKRAATVKAQQQLQQQHTAMDDDSDGDSKDGGQYSLAGCLLAVFVVFLWCWHY